HQWEEVNFRRAGLGGGGNYGWNIYEGLHCSSAGCDSAETNLPIIEYPHEDGNCSITGGYVYRGAQIPALWGNYLYSDYCSGIIWAAVLSADGVWETRIVAETGLNVSSFGEGVDGELYVIGYDGSIRRVVSAEQ
ncbi:MAG TPA: glucose dehydrogenase, partial [Anaerolineae bacterium]|nr:glucose dehydrogenase [Anaerolineae bacterium]